MKNIKVLIADDHAIVRMGLVALMESEGGIDVVGEACDGKDAVEQAVRLHPDVIVMDIMMPVLDGVSAVREVRQQIPDAKILILTTSTVSDDIDTALKSGAMGAITKSTANATLLEAIRTVANGNRYVSDEIAELIASDPPVPPLTGRQAEILDLVVKGLTNAEIGRLLGIAQDSTKEHINAIYQKIGAANRTEAVAIALRKHLLKT